LISLDYFIYDWWWNSWKNSYLWWNVCWSRSGSRWWREYENRC
jgi:hypothetical protein